MFKKIVVPVDGSESAWRALEQAAALACKFEGELLVMTVIQPYNNAALLAVPRTGSAGPRQRQSGCQRFYRQGGI